MGRAGGWFSGRRRSGGLGPAARMTTQRPELPIPPPEMRALVGPTDPAMFDNRDGTPVFGGLKPEQYRKVLDFGCGCGRLARQMIQQTPRPARYLGLDLHAGMIRWCTENLAPAAPGFEFRHHDVYYAGFNPVPDRPLYAPLPVGDGSFSLAVAISVFTHLTQVQTEAYLKELARILEPDGILLATWFLFDKQDFPMMQDDQNTLFINEYDVRNAVIYDRDWVRATAASVGLIISEVIPPTIRGFQWELRMTHPRPGVKEVDLPSDSADPGRAPPPPMPTEAYRIGRPDEGEATTTA